MGALRTNHERKQTTEDEIDSRLSTSVLRFFSQLNSTSLRLATVQTLEHLQRANAAMKRKHESTREHRASHLSNVAASSADASQQQSRFAQLSAASVAADANSVSASRNQRQNRRRQEAQAFDEPQDDDDDDDDEMFDDVNSSTAATKAHSLDASEDDDDDETNQIGDRDDSDDSENDNALTSDLTRNRKERKHTQQRPIGVDASNRNNDDAAALTEAQTSEAASAARHQRTVDAAEQRQADRLRQQSGLDSEATQQPESVPFHSSSQQQQQHSNSSSTAADDAQRRDQLAKRSALMQSDEAAHQAAMHALFDKRRGDVYDDFSAVEKHQGAGASVLDGGHAAVDEAELVRLGATDAWLQSVTDVDKANKQQHQKQKNNKSANDANDDDDEKREMQIDDSHQQQSAAPTKVQPKRINTNAVPQFTSLSARETLLRHMSETNHHESVTRAMQRLAKLQQSAAPKLLQTKMKNVRKSQQQQQQQMTDTPPSTDTATALASQHRAALFEFTQAVNWLCNSDGQMEIYESTRDELQHEFEQLSLAEQQKQRQLAMQQQQQQQQAAFDDEDEQEYVYKTSIDSADQHGPFSARQMAEWHAAGHLSAPSLVVKLIGTTEWLPIQQVQFGAPVAPAAAKTASVESQPQPGQIIQPSHASQIRFKF